MGLNRDFFLYAEHKDGAPVAMTEAEAIYQALCKRYDGWAGSLTYHGYLSISGANWYDNNNDMRDLSKEFPDILFTLHCDGMSLDDIWDAGFCDGRSDFQGAYIPELNTAYLLTGWNLLRGHNIRGTGGIA